MSEPISTSPVCPVQSSATVPVAVAKPEETPQPAEQVLPTWAEMVARLEKVPLYANACPELQTMLRHDMGVMTGPEGLPVEEYLESLATWGGDASSYLAENTDPDAKPEQAEPAATELVDETPAEPQPTATLAQANATLEKFGTACRNATDQNYKLGILASQFVDEFLGCSPGKSTRTVAVERLAGEWLKWDEESCSTPQATALKNLRARVNVLLKVHAVATLIGDGKGVAKGDGTKKGRGKKASDERLAWSTVREFIPLVDRANDEHSETWFILPTVAEDAKALLREVATSGMDRKNVQESVAKLLDKDRAARKVEADRQAEEARKLADARAAEQDRLRKERQEAEKQAAALKAAATEGTEEEQATKRAAAEEATRQAEEKRRQEDAARFQTEQADREKARRDQEAKDAQRKQDEADAKRKAKEGKGKGKGKGQATVKEPDATTPATTPPATTPPTDKECRQPAPQGQVLKLPSKATPKDAAAILAGTVRKHEDPLALVHEIAATLCSVPKGAEYGPDDMLQALLSGLENHSELSGKAKRAVKAALEVLNSKTSKAPSPAAVAAALTPASNGQPVTAA